MPHNIFAGGIVYLSGEILTVTLKRRDDIQRMAIPLPCPDSPSINHQGRPIQPPHGDQAARHIFVATRNRDQPIIPLSTHNRFDGIRDQVSRLQRVRHAIGSHADPIADTDRIETHADHIERLHRFLDLTSQVQQMHVARVSLEPHAADPDLRLVHVIGGKPGGVEHSLRGTLAFGLRDLRGIAVDRSHD